MVRITVASLFNRLNLLTDVNANRLLIPEFRYNPRTRYHKKTPNKH